MDFFFSDVFSSSENQSETLFQTLLLSRKRVLQLVGLVCLLVVDLSLVVTGESRVMSPEIFK